MKTSVQSIYHIRQQSIVNRNGRVKSHKQIELNARRKRKQEKLKRLKQNTTKHKFKSTFTKYRPVITPVRICDIRYNDRNAKGFVLNYCTRDEFGSAQNVSLHFYTYEEAVQAFKEAVIIQKF